MRRLRSPRNESRLLLFHTRPTTPAWQTLPVGIRRKVSGILARMLRQHRTRQFADGSGQEACD